ncbi:Zinc finger BED domain-containing protein [Melia azedarach]|uniref:Zinc finger BED domain-containing protein n=1 Tax=Melia azedarach TaxID=155640 RepID=A0ACC1YK25_MELAZ|nr:Zinc finger BED domain-containing protein [Melia azedarach]
MDGSCNENLETHQPHGQASSPAMDVDVSFSSHEGFWAPDGRASSSATEYSWPEIDKFCASHQPHGPEMYVGSEVHGNQAGNYMETHAQIHYTEFTEGIEVDGNQAGNNIEMDIVGNQEYVPAMEISGSLPNNEFLVTEREMIEETEVHGNQAANNIGKEILATDQPRALQVTGGREVDGNQGNNVEMDSVMNQRRKKRSRVWVEMTEFTGEDGRVWARCNHCGKVFDGSSKKGTTHLNNHLKICPRKRNNGAGNNADKQMHQTPNIPSSVVTEEKSVIDLIKSCFDKHGFLIKDCDPFALNSKKDEILKVYEEEKEELRRFLNQLPCRLSIGTGFYFGYYVLSVCYIDNSWQQKEKVVSVCVANEEEELHHNYQNLVKMLKESCLDLKIDGNICSIIYCDDIDSPFFKGDREDVIGEINSWFNQRGNSLPFGRLLFSYDTLSSICNEFGDSLGECLWENFGEIRKCINYVKRWSSNSRNFQIAIDNAGVHGKDILVGENSITNFGNAVGYKEAFLELERIDSNFKSRSINLTEEQWDEATVMHQHCEALLDSFGSLAESEYTTLNQYFPDFCDACMKLLSLRQKTQCYDLDEQTSTLIEKLSSELEVYNLILVVAAILDPRFKMEIVQLWYKKIYGRDADRYFEKIIHDFTDVYNKYYAKASEFEDTTSSSSYLDSMGRPCKSAPKSSLELERYLNDSKVPAIEDFDILAWWRIYTPIFPTLARMARDYLVLPINYRMPLNFNFFAAGDILDRQDLDHDIKLALLQLTDSMAEKS